LTRITLLAGVVCAAVTSCNATIEAIMESMIGSGSATHNRLVNRHADQRCNTRTATPERQQQNYNTLIADAAD
jgi:hypothetical protein